MTGQATPAGADPHSGHSISSADNSTELHTMWCTAMVLVMLVSPITCAGMWTWPTAASAPQPCSTGQAAAEAQLELCILKGAWESLVRGLFPIWQHRQVALGQGQAHSPLIPVHPVNAAEKWPQSSCWVGDMCGAMSVCPCMLGCTASLGVPATMQLVRTPASPGPSCCSLLQKDQVQLACPLKSGAGLRAGSEADQPGHDADPSGAGSGTTHTRPRESCWAPGAPRGVVALRERGR